MAQYNYVIHILAMLLVGFGFLMVFVRRYGFGATTGTYLVVAVGLPLYMLLRANGVFAHEIAPNTVKALLFAEFAVATALIAMGAVLGRLRVFQYALLALLLVPAYLMNEWLVLDNGMGLTEGYQDTAGSVIIHAFGAYFGLGLSLALTTARQRSSRLNRTPPLIVLPCSAQWCCGFSGQVLQQPLFLSRRCRKPSSTPCSPCAEPPSALIS